MDQEGGRNTGQADTSLVPPSDFDLRSVEDVFSEDDTVRCRPAKQNGVCGEHGRSEKLGFGIDIFQVVLLASVSTTQTRLVQTTAPTS